MNTESFTRSEAEGLLKNRTRGRLRETFYSIPAGTEIEVTAADQIYGAAWYVEIKGAGITRAITRGDWNRVVEVIP